MSVKRGEVVVIDWPFASGGGSKLRPAVVVQNNTDNARMTNTIVAGFTSVTHRSAQPTQLLIDVSTAEGKLTGLHQDSVLNCCNLFTIEQSKIVKTIGSFSPTLMQQADDCLRAAIGL